MIRNVVTVISILLSAGALGLSIHVARRQRTRDAFELARALHTDLTTGVVAEARSVLGGLTRGRDLRTPEETARAMDAYFTLLWCFERINAGRKSLKTWGSPAAQRFLLESIDWHVRGWDADLPIIRNVLKTQTGQDVHDNDSVVALQNLVRAVARSRTPTLSGRQSFSQ